jgi:hypothetical protein
MPGATATTPSHDQKPLRIKCYASTLKAAPTASLGSNATAALISPRRFAPAFSHWRERAAQMRALAVDTTDTEAAAIILKLAEDYDKSDRAEIRAQDQPQSEKRARD